MTWDAAIAVITTNRTRGSAASDDDQVTSFDFFDDDQLDAALEELDRRWVESGAPSWFPGRFRRGRQAFQLGDRESFLSIASPDMVAVDHRPLGMGERNRDDWASTMVGLGGNMSLVITEVIEIDGDLTIMRYRVTGSDGSVWDVLNIIEFAGNSFTDTTSTRRSSSV